MGGEDVLRRPGHRVRASAPARRALGWLAALAAALPLPAAAQDARSASEDADASLDGAEDRLAVRLPERLTAGGADHFMGVLAPDAGALWFVGDDARTLELFVQRPPTAGARRAFDGSGDVAWPRPSPDGRHLAYVSYVADATGDACVRPADGGDERCLTGLDTAELQVLWLDAGHLGVLSRSRLHGDFRLVSHAIDGSGTRVLLERNAVGVAVSPDGRWLAWVPLRRARREVGVTFSNRTAPGLRLARLGAGGAGEPVAWVPPLPGVTGYPAFSPDGRWLYFAQYLNDTNRDGHIDGNDHGVVFRVPFDAAAAPPVTDGVPSQLTSARWNCHYPSPSADRLVLTCSLGGSLDVYTLPLDGAVPAAWDPERLAAERGAARDLWTKLLISGRLLAATSAPAARAPILRDMAWTHLALREHESAAFYATRLADEAATPDAPQARVGRLLAALAFHRRDDAALARGRPSLPYAAATSRRLAEARALGAGAGPVVAATARLVEAELLSDLGEKGAARALLDGVALDAVDDPLPLELAADVSRRLRGWLADRDAHLALLAVLAAHPAHTTDDRLRHARALARAAGRGRAPAARRAVLAAWRDRADPRGELALVLDVELALADLDATNEEAIRERIFALYRENDDPARRRAIALATIQAASAEGNEYLQYQFATTWASGLRQLDPERKYAEALHRTVLLERGYGERADHELSEAAGYFFQAARNAGSLEAHVGFVESRIAGGDGPEDVAAFYDRRFADDRDDPSYRFVRAYLEARALPDVDDPDRLSRIVDDVMELLAGVARDLPRRIEVHHLWGFALHERALATGAREDAAAANRQYLLALDLARESPRSRATLRQALGLLQASLGNHGRALEHLDARAALPFVRPETELSFRLARSRSRWHQGDGAGAVEDGERALALVDATPSLAPFRPLVVVRLAFVALDAGRHARARALYRGLPPALPEDAPPVTRLAAAAGLASACLALGEAREALDAVDAGRRILAAGAPLGDGDPASFGGSLVHDFTYGPDRWAALLDGFEARAWADVGDLEAARVAARARRDRLATLGVASGTDEDLHALAHAELDLGLLAWRAGDLDGARLRLEAGLADAARWAERTGTPVDPLRLALLRAYAELHLYGGVPHAALARDLAAELAEVHRFLGRFRNPAWATHRFLFSLYRTRLSLRDAAASAARPPSP